MAMRVRSGWAGRTLPSWTARLRQRPRRRASGAWEAVTIGPEVVVIEHGGGLGIARRALAEELALPIDLVYEEAARWVSPKLWDRLVVWWNPERSAVGRGAEGEVVVTWRDALDRLDASAPFLFCSSEY